MADLLDDIIQILTDFRWSLDAKAITKQLVASEKYRETKSLRLSQVAKSLNKGLSAVASSLSAKGFIVEINPNTKINTTQLNILVEEYKSTQLQNLLNQDEISNTSNLNGFDVPEVNVSTIDLLIKNNTKIFRIEPNGSVSLRYDETFRKIEKTISSTFRSWGFKNVNENSFIMLFLLRIFASSKLENQFNIPQSKIDQASFSDRVFILLNSLNTNTDIFRDNFSDIAKSWDKNLDWPYFEKLLPEISSIPEKLYGRYFSDFTRTSAHKEWLGFYEPNSIISELIAQLVYPFKPKIVYDPYGGMGDFIIEINRLHLNNKFILSDNNPSVSRIGKINLILNGVYNFKYNIQNSLSEDRNAIQADVIVTNPPFGNVDKKIDRSLSFKNNDNSFTTHALLNIIKDINDEGHAFVIVPEGFLFHPKQTEIRRYLVKNNWIKSIISLPADLLRPFSGVKVSILHIHKSYEGIGSIRFIKGSYSSNNKELNQGILNLATKHSANDNNDSDVLTIPESKILTGNVELLINRFEKIKNRDYGNYSVEQLVKSVLPGVNYKKNNVNSDQSAPFVIRQGDLPKVVEDIYIDVKQTQRYLITSGPIEFISRDSVLFPRFGSRFYPALYDSKENAVIDGTSLIGIKLDTKKVLPEYFAYQFYEPAVEQQIKQFATAVAHIQKISRLELYRVKLYIPSIEDQKLYIKNKKQSAIREVKTASEGVAYERFSSLKHSMATPLNVLKADIDMLFDFLDENINNKQLISNEDYIVPMLDESQKIEWEDKRFFSYKDRIKRNVRFLQNSLQKVDDLIRVNKPLQLEKVNLKKLWKEVLEDNNDSFYTYRINGIGSANVEADKHLLKSAFSYLVENTIKHGFGAAKKTEYQEITVDLEEQPGNQILIWYRNNGRPFAEDFDLETIFEKGRTSDSMSGSGFGGFVLYQIIVRHEGEIQPYSLSQDPYPVQFKISLPINHDY